MNMVFFNLLDTCVVVHLDDLLVFSKIVEEHRIALNNVFARLDKH